MKLRMFFKRFLCLLIISATLLLTCACASEEGSESNSDSAFSSDSSLAGQSEKDDKKIIISENPSIRIVYSSSYKTLAQAVANNLIRLDKGYVKGSGKYAIYQDTEIADDDTPEIIIGDTNRSETAEAKKLVSKKNGHYAIYVSNSSIAIYAKEALGIKAAVDAFLLKVSKKNDAVIYDNSKGNIVKDYSAEEETETPPAEKPQAAPILEVRTPEKSDVNGDTLLNALKSAAGSKAYSVAVSTTDGIKVAAIRNTNAQNTYSVSKVYCVTAIGMLYDEGLIKTTDTIGDIFKAEIKTYGINENKWKNVTIDDVLRHRAGFTSGGLLDIDQDASLMNKHDDFLKVVLNYNLNTTRDKNGNMVYNYTDAAYYLISRVVAKVSGEKLDEYLKTRLFDVAGYKDYKITKCPKGHPIGATQFYLRPDDVVKLGRIYLDGGTYNGKRIISQDWINQVIRRGYELTPSNNGYAKGGMRGQYLYVNFEHNVAVAWLSETNDGTSNLGAKLKSYMPKKS